MENRTMHTAKNNLGDEIDLFNLAGLLFRQKKMILIAVVAVMALTAIKVYLTPNSYCSTASILPTGKVDKFTELRKLTGFGGSGASDENSSELFPTIIRSRLIQDALLSKKYSVSDDENKGKMSLSEYFSTNNPDRLSDAIAKITTVYTDAITGVISISVETAYPKLSQSIVQEYLTELENYNLHKRRSQAKQNEQYLASQLVIVKSELASAENELEQFQYSNRNWNISTDPEMLRTLGGLKREVTAKSAAYLFLQEQHEVAKLEVQKDIPIVRLLDSPTYPTIKSGPRRKLSIFLAGVASFFFMIIFAVAVDAIKRKYRDSEKESFEALRRDITSAFPRSTRILKMVKNKRANPKTKIDA